MTQLMYGAWNNLPLSNRNRSVLNQFRQLRLRCFLDERSNSLTLSLGQSNRVRKIIILHGARILTLSRSDVGASAREYIRIHRRIYKKRFVLLVHRVARRISFLQVLVGSRVYLTACVRRSVQEVCNATNARRRYDERRQVWKNSFLSRRVQVAHVGIKRINILEVVIRRNILSV